MGCWPKRSWLRQRHRWRCCRTLCRRPGLLPPEWPTAELRLPDCSGLGRRSVAQGGGTAVSVNESMNLAREGAVATSHAAICGPPFCSSHRVGGRGRGWSGTSRSRRRRRRKPQQAAGPTPRLCASGRTGCSRSSRDRIARVSPPTASQSGNANECRSAPAGHQRGERRMACSVAAAE